MSKAFTKEPDGDDDEPELDDDTGAPAGFTNYITPAGFKRLNEELARLWHDDRPKLVETIAWAASNGDRSENGDYIYGKRKLREIDRRIRFLSKRLDSAVLVDNTGKTITIITSTGAGGPFVQHVTRVPRRHPFLLQCLIGVVDDDRGRQVGHRREGGDPPADDDALPLHGRVPRVGALRVRRIRVQECDAPGSGEVPRQ